MQSRQLGSFFDQVPCHNAFVFFHLSANVQFTNNSIFQILMQQTSKNNDQCGVQAAQESQTETEQGNIINKWKSGLTEEAEDMMSMQMSSIREKVEKRINQRLQTRFPLVNRFRWVSKQCLKIENILLMHAKMLLDIIVSFFKIELIVFFAFRILCLHNYVFKLFGM